MRPSPRMAPPRYPVTDTSSGPSGLTTTSSSPSSTSHQAATLRAARRDDDRRRAPRERRRRDDRRAPPDRRAESPVRGARATACPRASASSRRPTTSSTLRERQAEYLAAALDQEHVEQRERSGRTSVTSVPLPGSLRTSSVPPNDSTCSLTASSPTPRPESSVTSIAVEKPARASTSASEPSCARLCENLLDTPRPSSATTISTMPPRCSARSSTVARGGLPAAGARPAARFHGRPRCAGVHERLGETLEDDAVELGVGPARSTSSTSLPVCGGDVANGAREARR